MTVVGGAFPLTLLGPVVDERGVEDTPGVATDDLSRGSGMVAIEKEGRLSVINPRGVDCPDDVEIEERSGEGNGVLFCFTALPSADATGVIGVALRSSLGLSLDPITGVESSDLRISVLVPLVAFDLRASFPPSSDKLSLLLPESVSLS